MHDRDEDFTQAHEEAIYGHYGRTGYWDAIRARQTAPAPTPEIAEAEVQDAIRRGDDPNQVAVKRWGCSPSHPSPKASEAPILTPAPAPSRVSGGSEQWSSQDWGPAKLGTHSV